MDKSTLLKTKNLFYCKDYDAVKSSKRRRLPRVNLKSSDEHLKKIDRDKLVSSARDIQRNFAIAGWAIRKHLDFTTQFSLQVQTGNKQLDDRIENLMEWYSQPENCDVAGRHSLENIIRLAEERRIIDGDVFLVKLSDGKLQAVEADRIRTPDSGIPDWVNDQLENITHGVIHTNGGKARGYIATRRDKFNRFKFDRVIRSGFVIHHGFYDRFDQIRGISPLAPVINLLRDSYEAHDYALAKMKLSQLMGLVFYRDNYDGFSEEDEGADGVYDINFKDSLAVINLDPGDRADFIESKNPSSEFANFMKQTIADALKGLDIPYSYYDEAHTNYSGARQAMLLHNKSAAPKREQVRRVLNEITKWKLFLFVQEGILKIPAGMRITDLKFEWVYKGLPWIDPLKEVKADIESINSGLASTPEICKRRGKSAYDIADEEAKIREYRKSLGLDSIKE